MAAGMFVCILMYAYMYIYGDNMIQLYILIISLMFYLIYLIYIYYYLENPILIILLLQLNHICSYIYKYIYVYMYVDMYIYM